MVRFWRPAIMTAVSSSGIRANSVRQRLYSPRRDEILRAAVVDGLGSARLAAEAEAGFLRPGGRDLPSEPGPTGTLSDLRPRGADAATPPGTSGRTRTQRRPQPALNSETTVLDSVYGQGRINRVTIAQSHLYCDLGWVNLVRTWPSAEQSRASRRLHPEHLSLRPAPEREAPSP